MKAQQRREQGLHVTVARMDLIDDKQVSRQAGQAQMRMLGLDDSKQGLVDRAYGDRSGEELFRPRGGPDFFRVCRFVLPNIMATGGRVESRFARDLLAGDS